MGNCVRQGSVKVGTIQKKKSKDPNAIKRILEQVDKIEQEEQVTQTKKVNKTTTGNGSSDDENNQSPDAEKYKKKKSKIIEAQQSLKKKKTTNENDRSPTNDRKKTKETKNFAEDGLQQLQNPSMANHILIQIEEQRSRYEGVLKQQINDLNLEKNVSNSIFQLLRDYLSHIKDTKKYWVKIKFIGYSKSEYNLNQVGGSISIVVEYNTGEMVKLRIIFSKDMEKSNFDLDTFVYYSQLENPNLVKVQDFNFRISPKYMRYYIFSESNYHEASIQQMIIKQANTEKPQMTSSSFRQMFTDILNLLNYFSEVKFTHGGIYPSNIYVNKYMEKDGHYIQKALVDMSLSNNAFNRRNTKFKEFAFRKSSDLQMFAIAMLSLMSSMDINSIQETNKKSIISSKLSASSIIQVDNDIRYMLYCILKGSDMILEFGAQEIKQYYDNSISYDNHLALNRPNQQKNQIQFCYYINNSNEIIVYSFYTKWVFGYRVYDSIKQDNKVIIRQSYCSGDYLYFIFEIIDSSDLFISKINLRKKCLDNKSLSIIKAISDTLCKLQGIKNEEELDMMQAFEILDTKEEDYVSADDFLQFSYENKIKELQNNQNQDFTTIISYFDEQDNGKLNFYEFKNMVQYIMCSRPYISFEIPELIELPRHYVPSNMFKKGNYLYLIGGQFQSLPTNKCFKYFAKDLKENQEIQLLDTVSQNGFMIDTIDSKKIIFWSWNLNEQFLNQPVESNQEGNVVKINLNDVLSSENYIDVHKKKNNNILQFENTQEMKNAMMSQKSISELKAISSTKSIGQLLKIVRTASIPINVTIEAEKGDEKKNKNIMMNVYNTDKNIWSSCQIQEENFKRQNFYLPLAESGQVIIFEKDNYQNAQLVGITLDHIEIHYLSLYFQNKAAVEQMISGVIKKQINVAFYENSLLFIRKSTKTNQFYYCVFIINEETGIVSYYEYEFISYLGKYDRISKIPIRYLKPRKSGGNNSQLYSSQYFMQMSGLSMFSKSSSSINGSQMKQKIKINRYNIDQVLATFGDTFIYSANRSSFPNLEFKIFCRSINNSTEKIDDIYETLKYLSQNQLQGRIPPVKDAFFAFEQTTSSIKLNLVYSNEDIGASMAEVIASLQFQRHKIKSRLLQSISIGYSKKKKRLDFQLQNGSSRIQAQKLDGGEASTRDSNQERTPIRKRNSKSMSKIGMRRESIQNGDLSKMKKKSTIFPARIYDLISNLKNVLICLHQLQQNRFFLKEVSPHTLISVKDGKYFSPMNFYHENTFTTINSDIKESIIKENSIYADYLPPQLLKAHEEGLYLNDINYNIHKSNIYSLGLIFLQYASLKRNKGYNRMESASQVKLSIAISTLPYPKYIQDIFTHMLKINEDDRLNAAQLLDLIHQILLEHKTDIYFPQLQQFSPFNSDKSNSNSSPLKSQNKTAQQQPSQTVKSDFYYTYDNPGSTLYLGGKSLLLEFKRNFKVDDKVTMEMNSVIGLTKFSAGFYSVVKYPTQPSEALPQSIFKYIFVKLIGHPTNPKIIQGSLICSLPQFTGRDIIYLNLTTVEQQSILIYGGAENTSVGQMDIKETYLVNDLINDNSISTQNKGNNFTNSNEEGERDSDEQKKYMRLDDLKNSVGRAQIFSYQISSQDHRYFDYESISDDDYDDGNIPERSEQDEEDQEYQKGINAQSDQESEEEEKKENSVKDQAKQDTNLDKTTEYHIMDQRLIFVSYFKRQISIQVIKADYSVQQRYVSIRVNQGQNNTNIQSNKSRATQNLLQSNNQGETLQYIPLTDSLVIGLDIESQQAFLISLISFKSMNLNMVNDVPQSQQIQLKNVKKLSQKFYLLTTQKCFLYIYQKDFDLICHTYELDIEKMTLYLNSQMIILPNYGYVQSNLQNEGQKTTTEDDEFQNNKIMLPQLTLQIQKSSDEQSHIQQIPTNNFINKNGSTTPTDEKLPTPSSIRSLNSPIERIQEESDDDDDTYQDQDSYKRKGNYQQKTNQHQHKHQKFQTQKSKLGLIKQVDTLVDSVTSSHNNTTIQANENQKLLESKIEEGESSDYSEEEKQDMENQKTVDIQKIIQIQIDQNKKLLLQQSLEVSPTTSPTRLNNLIKFKFNGSQESSPNSQVQTEEMGNNYNNNDTGNYNQDEQNKTLFNIEAIPQNNGQQNNQNSLVNTQHTLQSLRQFLSNDQINSTNTQLSINHNNKKNQSFYQDIYQYPSKDEIQSTVATQKTLDNIQNNISYSQFNKKSNTLNPGIEMVEEASQDSHTLTSKMNSQTVITTNVQPSSNNQSKQQTDNSTFNILSQNQTQEKISEQVQNQQQNESPYLIDDFNIQDNVFNQNHDRSSNFSQDENYSNMLMIDQDF